jgi:hypothetical protein
MRPRMSVPGDPRSTGAERIHAPLFDNARICGTKIGSNTLAPDSLPGGTGAEGVRAFLRLSSHFGRSPATT